MALPAGITPKTVQVGIPTKFNGTPATGSATLTAPKNLVHVPTGTPLFSGSVTKQFKGLTQVEFTDLVPTDADGLNRVDWTYTLTVRVNGAVEQPEPIVFVIPEAGPDTIDADLLVEVPSSAGTPVSALVLTAENVDPLTATYLADPDSETRLALDGLDLGGLDDAGVAALVADAASASTVALRAAFGADEGRTLYVSATGNNGNDGSTWRKAFSTINAALTAIGDDGGTIHIGAGTFAAATLTSASTLKRGIRLVGRGMWRTEIKATTTGQDAFRVTPAAGKEIVNLSFEGIAFTGSKTGTVTGHGLNLGGGVWPAIGQVEIRGCRMESNGKAGLFCMDINEMKVDTCRIRLNGTHGVHITGNTTDGDGGTVARGNTCVFINTNVHSNTGNGYYFDRAGNSWTIIGGELHSHTAGDAIVVIPGSSFRGLTCIGVHFEGNLRGALLGDNAAETFLATNIGFDGCHFTNQTGAYDVLLNGVENVTFDRCQFGGTTAGVKVSNTATNRYRLSNCKGSNSTKLIEDRAGTVWNAAQDFEWGERIRIINDSGGHADNVSPALMYLKNTNASAHWIALADASNTVGIYLVTATPEGALTAPPGSLAIRPSGGAGATLYVKETGTGNTGWVGK